MATKTDFVTWICFDFMLYFALQVHLGVFTWAPTPNLLTVIFLSTETNDHRISCDFRLSGCVLASKCCFWRAQYRQFSSCHMLESGSFVQENVSSQFDSQLGRQIAIYLAEYRQIYWEVWDYIFPPLSAYADSQIAGSATVTNFCSSFRSWNLLESAKLPIHWRSIDVSCMTSSIQSSGA